MVIATGVQWNTGQDRTPGTGLSSPSRWSPPSGPMPSHPMGVRMSLITAAFSSPSRFCQISGWEAGGSHCLSQRLFLDMRNRDLLSLVAGLWGAGGAEPTGAQGCHYTPLASLGICSFLPVARTPPHPAFPVLHTACHHGSAALKSMNSSPAQPPADDQNSPSAYFSHSREAGLVWLRCSVAQMLTCL